MSHKSNNKEIKGEIDPKNKGKVAELEASLKEKTKLQGTHLMYAVKNLRFIWFSLAI